MLCLLLLSAPIIPEWLTAFVLFLAAIGIPEGDPEWLTKMGTKLSKLGPEPILLLFLLPVPYLPEALILSTRL